MKFKIESGHTAEQRKLFYTPEEYSFGVEPTVLAIDFDIVVNYLILTAVEGKIIEVSGFCPYGAWTKSSYTVSKYTKGILRVIDNLEPGFSYRLNDVDWPIYVNVQTGWVCVGNPTAPGEGVEFMDNCVAIIGNGELVALWLKPESLPEL